MSDMPEKSATAPTNHSSKDLNVSLEPHLVESLQPLLHLLPSELVLQLEPLVPPPEGSPSNLIDYSLLSSISAWARSPDGAKSLASYNPPLRPADYSMIALLAGTRTSPERKFPAYATRKEGADERKTYSDRRAVTNVFNALLSIGGAGAATWWAAGRLDWKDEWKALLSLAVALIVAASEVVLYLIWDSRRSQPPRPLSHRSAARIEPSESKKAQEVSPDSSVDSDAASGEVGPMSTAVANTRGSANLRERTTAGQPPDS